MSFGANAVDYQQRVDFDRLRKYRLGRVQGALAQAGLGAVICFDPDNIRYATGTHQGEWSRDKMVRYCLLPASGAPVLFDTRALSHSNRYPERYPWLLGNVRHSQFLWRGAWHPQEPRADNMVGALKGALSDLGLAGAPVGVDVLDMQFLAAAQRAGLNLVDGQDAMLEARLIKSVDEIELMRIAAAIAEGAFWEFTKFLRPGVRENEMVAFVSSELYKRGAERTTYSVATGPSTNPHSNLFGDRIVRPGDVVYMDIQTAYAGYRTCYYRTFVAGEATKAHREVYQRCLDWLRTAIETVGPGITTGDVAANWPAAEQSGTHSTPGDTFLELGHGLGIGLWEKPVINREVSLDYPLPLAPGMVLALETYAGSDDGTFGIRIEDEVLVTPDGREVLTAFPTALIECDGR